MSCLLFDFSLLEVEETYTTIVRIDYEEMSEMYDM